MNEALNSLLQQSPLAALAGAIIIWLVRRLREKEEEIKELNTVIREQQKECIEVMNENTNVTKELTSVIKYGKS